MNRAAFMAIGFRVNTAMLYAAMGDREKASEQFTKLLDFMETLVKR